MDVISENVDEFHCDDSIYRCDNFDPKFEYLCIYIGESACYIAVL